MGSYQKKNRSGGGAGGGKQLPLTKQDHLGVEKKKDGDGAYPTEYKSVIIQRRKQRGGKKK